MLPSSAISSISTSTTAAGGDDDDDDDAGLSAAIVSAYKVLCELVVSYVSVCLCLFVYAFICSCVCYCVSYCVFLFVRVRARVCSCVFVPGFVVRFDAVVGWSSFPRRFRAHFVLPSFP